MTQNKPSGPAPRILVLGGTGFVGRALCEALVRALPGARITVPTRRLAAGQALQSLPSVELQCADVMDPLVLPRLVMRADAVVNLIAIAQGSDAAFTAVHIDLPKRLAQACGQVGLRRVVHVSALGVAADAPSRYLRSKHAGEQVFRDAALDLTVLRPSVIFGAQDRFINLFAQLQAVFPVLPLAGAHTKFQPVWVEDVAAGIVQALQQRDTAGQTFEAVGPQVYTLAELARLAGRWSGHERWVLPLPHWAARAQAFAMECLPGTPIMSRDNLDSMRVPNVASGLLPTLQALGIQPSNLDAVVPGYLSAGQGMERLDRWRAAR